MARQKLPITLLIEEIDKIRGVKLPKKYHKRIKNHLANSIVHRSIFERGDYNTLAKILRNYISLWIKEDIV